MFALPRMGEDSLRIGTKKYVNSESVCQEVA